MKHLSAYISLAVSVLVLLGISSCGQQSSSHVMSGSLHYAELFDLSVDESGNPLVISISPYDNSRDTLCVSSPLSRIVCMSSTHVACLDALGCDSVIVGASGKSYLSNVRVKKSAVEVGYDPDIDYEAVLSVNPDLFVAYSVSEADPQYVRKLRELGVPVLLISDHLEQHPLARAEYVRLFGALVGKLPQADDYFSKIEGEYLGIAEIITSSDVEPAQVLINVPYSGEWFIPGGDNYTARLVSDAGGEILHAEKGKVASSVISMEEAYVMSAEADVWLNPGWCKTKKDLLSVSPLFKEFPSVRVPVYNNTLRENSEGGNDFWESGAVHPELILSDLATILHPDLYEADSLYYYIEVK